MFTFLIGLILTGIGSVSAWLSYSVFDNEFPEFLFGLVGLILIILGLIFIAISVFGTLDEYAEQIKSFERIRLLREKLKVFTVRRDELYEEVKDILGEKYPKLTESIFEAMAKKDGSVNATDYPEINGDAVFKDMIAKVIELRDRVYNVKIEIEDERMKIRYRQKNPWFFNSFILQPDSSLMNDSD